MAETFNEIHRNQVNQAVAASNRVIEMKLRRFGIDLSQGVPHASVQRGSFVPTSELETDYFKAGDVMGSKPV